MCRSFGSCLGLSAPRLLQRKMITCMLDGGFNIMLNMNELVTILRFRDGCLGSFNRDVMLV